MKKRVGCFYRVSTKKQVNKEDDIPMQRYACMEYIKLHDDWEFECEYVEKGVSGFHKTLADREVLQNLLKDVKAKKFDVLLVYMFDRLGRRDDETPRILKSIVANNIEVWSKCEGQQTFENASDDLMNYIRFWGASTESKKTSARVDSGRAYLTKQGKFTGGRVPYGYQLVPTGKANVRGHMINDFVKEPTESAVVEKMFRLVIDENETLNGLVEYLEVTMGIKTRNGKRWSTSVIRNILTNPLYKGYFAYGKTRMLEVKENDNDTDMKSLDFLEVKKTQKRVPADQWVQAEKRNEELAIVSESDWQLVQEILAKRNKRYNDCLRPIEDRTYKSSLLLVGLLECGYCHHAISPAISSQKSVSKNGEITRCYTDFYKCNTRGRGKELCKAKSYISKRRLEKVVLDEVGRFLDRIESIDCSAELADISIDGIRAEVDSLNKMKKTLSSLDDNIKKLKEEVYKVVIGESDFDRKVLNDLLSEKEKEKSELEADIAECESTIKSKQLAIDEYKKTVEMVPVWRDVFDNAPLNIKKHLLSILIEKIVVTGNRVDIHFKIDIDSFLNIRNVGGNEQSKAENVGCITKQDKQLYRKVIEESVNIEKCTL